MTTAVPAEHHARSLTHEAVPYETKEESLSGTVAYVLAALAKDQPVLMDLPGDRMQEVRDALGPDARQVVFGDMSTDGRNPASIIPGVIYRFIDDHPDQRSAIVLEPMWPGRSAAAYTACVEHEALINLAFPRSAADVLCRYDIASLPKQALADILRTHPVVRERTTTRVNSRYEDPRLVLESIADLQPHTPGDALMFHFTEVAQARHVAAEWGAAHGLASERLTDALIAVSEVAGNSVAHAGDGGSLLCWRDNGSLVYEVRDGGHIQDALAGRLPPPWEQESGRGLLMVNLLCDLVQLKSSPSGTVVRMWIAVPT